MKKKVLIAEDDEDIRNIVGYILEDEGYEVIGCDCTLRNIAAIQADLILLDEWINLKEGPMLCKEIKAIEQLEQVPVIIFSTSSDIAGIADNCKANGYVHKPFDLDKLISEVRKFLPLDKTYARA
ncbi:response regulator [Mucilaginibacter litoreus]|uniref:Response regulator n=1 Tax=Mucilaginibacter litoreus TaxID=1048221 RepID=A0ABW3AWL8_9SPHI